MNPDRLPNGLPLRATHGKVAAQVTHDAWVAAHADREAVVRDGKVTTLTGAAP